MSVISDVLSRLEVVRTRPTRERSWRTWSGTARAALAAADLVVSAAVVWVLAGGPSGGPGALVGAVVTGIVLVLVIGARGGYRNRAMTTPRTGVLALLGAIAMVALAAMVAAYLGLLEISPRLLLSAGLGAGASLLVVRGGYRLLLRRLRRNGKLDQRTLLVGSGTSLHAAYTAMQADTRHRLIILGRCGPADASQEELEEIPVLGDLQDVPATIGEFRIDTLVLGADCLSAQELRRLRWRIEPLGTQLLLAPNVADLEPSRVAMTHIGGTPMLDLASGPSRTTIIAKQVFDQVVGLMLLLLASVVLVPAMVAVRVSSRGPATFRQTRVGEDGVPFVMYKLRTMYLDAEDRLADLLEHSDGNDVLFKMKHDPRVTRVGRILRRLSIDELPQLWNVCRAQMSLVGPRPPLPSEVADYDDLAYHRLWVKPGLTGLWQVSGRSDLSWQESIRLDLRYVDNWSVGMDLTILARTAWAVIGGRGAY